MPGLYILLYYIVIVSNVSSVWCFYHVSSHQLVADGSQWLSLPTTYCPHVLCYMVPLKWRVHLAVTNWSGVVDMFFFLKLIIFMWPTSAIYVSLFTLTLFFSGNQMCPFLWQPMIPFYNQRRWSYLPIVGKQYPGPFITNNDLFLCHLLLLFCHACW